MTNRGSQIHRFFSWYSRSPCVSTRLVDEKSISLLEVDVEEIGPVVQYSKFPHLDVRDAELFLQSGEGAGSENTVISMLQNKPKGDFKADLEIKPPQVRHTH